MDTGLEKGTRGAEERVLPRDEKTQMSASVLLMAYGSVESVDQMADFLKDVFRGRPVREATVREFQERYRLFGGRSPLLDITKRQAAALETSLGMPVRVALPQSAPRDETTNSLMILAGHIHELQAHAQFLQDVDDLGLRTDFLGIAGEPESDRHHRPHHVGFLGGHEHAPVAQVHQTVMPVRVDVYILKDRHPPARTLLDPSFLFHRKPSPRGQPPITAST